MPAISIQTEQSTAPVEGENASATHGSKGAPAKPSSSTQGSNSKLDALRRDGTQPSKVQARQFSEPTLPPLTDTEFTLPGLPQPTMPPFSTSTRSSASDTTVGQPNYTPLPLPSGTLTVPGLSLPPLPTETLSVPNLTLPPIPSATLSPPPGPGPSDTGMVAGAVLGVVGGLTAAAAGVWLYMRGKRSGSAGTQQPPSLPMGPVRNQARDAVPLQPDMPPPPYPGQTRTTT